MPTPEEMLAGHLRDAETLALYEKLKAQNPIIAAEYQSRHGGAIYRAAQLRNDGGASLLPTRAIEPRHVAKRI